jgi:1,4-alpha-glucan branching enzyme
MQNHDQIGNRPTGERLITISGLEAAKLAAGLTLLSPFTPLIFMGEEYGETSPFLFFTDYSDESLREKVQVGKMNLGKWLEKGFIDFKNIDVFEIKIREQGQVKARRVWRTIKTDKFRIASKQL